MTKGDLQIEKDVLDELAFDPTVDATDVSVSANDGVVTLRGTVRSYPEKLAAERAAKRVAGVHGIAEELKIEVPAMHHRTDNDIARAAVVALDSDMTIPKGKVTAKVENGWLTLDGEVDWYYQKDAARRAVEHLLGIRGVTNSIVVRPAVDAGDVKATIRQAFERSADIDASKVQVEVVNGRVTLRGDVRSWHEHDDAAYAAYSVPGVNYVDNQTHVV